jgi:hypothetical protein
MRLPVRYHKQDIYDNDFFQIFSKTACAKTSGELGGHVITTRNGVRGFQRGSSVNIFYLMKQIRQNSTFFRPCNYYVRIKFIVCAEFCFHGPYVGSTYINVPE